MSQYRVSYHNRLSKAAIGESKVLTFELNRDAMSKATSNFTVATTVPTSVELGDFALLRNEYGKIIYIGEIEHLEELKVDTNQALGIFNDDFKYQTQQFADIESSLKYYIENVINDNTDPKVFGLLDSFLTTTSSTTNLTLKSQEPNTVLNFEDFLYSIFEKYQILTKIHIPFLPSEQAIIDFGINSDDKITLADNSNAILNFEVTETVYETNKLVIYSEDGSTLRGTFFGSTDGITSDPNSIFRLDRVRTNIVFSNDDINLLKAQNLRNEMYNHKIELELSTKSTLYNWEDFELGQKVELFLNKKYYDSVITAISISKSDFEISRIKLTFGMARKKTANILRKLVRSNV